MAVATPKSSAGADTTSEGRRSSMAFVLDQPYAPSSNGRRHDDADTSSDYSSSSVSVSTNRTISSVCPAIAARIAAVASIARGRRP